MGDRPTPLNSAQAMYRRPKWWPGPVPVSTVPASWSGNLPLDPFWEPLEVPMVMGTSPVQAGAPPTCVPKLKFWFACAFALAGSKVVASRLIWWALRPKAWQTTSKVLNFGFQTTTGSPAIGNVPAPGRLGSLVKEVKGAKDSGAQVEPPLVE